MRIPTESKRSKVDRPQQQIRYVVQETIGKAEHARVVKIARSRAEHDRGSAQCAAPIGVSDQEAVRPVVRVSGAAGPARPSGSPGRPVGVHRRPANPRPPPKRAPPVNSSGPPPAGRSRDSRSGSPSACWKRPRNQAAAPSPRRGLVQQSVVQQPSRATGAPERPERREQHSPTTQTTLDDRHKLSRPLPRIKASRLTRASASATATREKSSLVVRSPETLQPETSPSRNKKHREVNHTKKEPRGPRNQLAARSRRAARRRHEIQRPNRSSNEQHERQHRELNSSSARNDRRPHKRQSEHTRRRTQERQSREPLSEHHLGRYQQHRARKAERQH